METKDRRLNVHLRMDEPAELYCARVNAAIRAITPSAVVFDAGSSMIPHVSMLMGAASPDIDWHEGSAVWDHVKKLLAQAASGLRPRFTMLPPTLRRSTAGYVLSDLRASSDYFELRDRAHALFHPKYISEKSGAIAGVDGQPHVTLGFVSARYAAVDAAMSAFPADFSFNASAVGISDVGPKGSCVNSLVRLPV